MRRSVSILLLVILALVSVVFFLVTSVKMNLLTPGFLKGVLAERGIYTLALQQIDIQIERLNLDPNLPVTHAEIAEVVHEIVTEQWLRQNIESVIDGFAAWLDAPPGTTLVLPLEIGSVRDRLTGAVDVFLARKLPEVKPCPSSRRSQEEQGICQFAGLSVAEAKVQLAHVGLDIAAFQKLIPDQIDLIRPDLSAIIGPSNPNNPDSAERKGAEIEAQLDEVKGIYHQALRYFWYAWGGYGVLILLYIVLNATGGWRRLVRWAGILLLTVSILPLAAAIASAPVVEGVVLNRISLPPEFPLYVQTLAIDAIKDARRAIFLPLFFTMIAVAVLGLVGIVGAQWLPKRVRR